MATKMIKFDLQMKGVKVTTLEELQENFSADILPIFQTGRLVKWLMSRELVTQAEAIAVIDKNSTELQQLASICQVLELDDDEDVLQFLLDELQDAQAKTLPLNEIVVEVDAEDLNQKNGSNSICESNLGTEANQVNIEINQIQGGFKTEVQHLPLKCFFDEYEAQFKRANECGLLFGSYLSENKGLKKIENAENSYAKYRGRDCNLSPAGSLLMLIDTTVWGSASDGFYITSEELFVKEAWEDGWMVKIRDIKRCRIDSDDKNVEINGRSFSYLSDTRTASLKIVFRCIEKYNNQFA